MAEFIVAPKVMFTCQSEGAILYCDLHSRLMYPQTHTRAHTHKHPLHCPCPSPLFHPPTQQLPLQTPNHAITGKESHRNQQNLFSSYHTKKKEDKKPLQSITAHRTALSSHHWHLGERLAEGGGGGESGWADIFCQTPSSGQVLYCGHLLILCWYTGQLAAESNHGSDYYCQQ